MVGDERFWTKVREVDDCWLWVGHKNTMTGIGLYAVARGDFREAHVYSWEMENGPLPEVEGRQIRLVEQTCKKPNCVRPDHMIVIVGNNQNEIDKERKRLTEIKTADLCPKGHPYVGENLVIGADGYRRCRECRNTARRARRAQKTVEKNTFSVENSDGVNPQEKEKTLIL